MGDEKLEAIKNIRASDSFILISDRGSIIQGTEATSAVAINYHVCGNSKFVFMSFYEALKEAEEFINTGLWEQYLGVTISKNISKNKSLNGGD